MQFIEPELHKNGIICRGLTFDVIYHSYDIALNSCVMTSRSVADTLGGISTEQEMCLAYFMYYPRLPASLCWGAVSNLEEHAGAAILACNEDFVVFDIPNITTKYEEVGGSQIECL